MSVFTCEHCDDGLATETLATTGEKVCPDCLEFLNPNKCDECGIVHDSENEQMSIKEMEKGKNENSI